MVNNETTYNSLEDIQARREALAKEIDASEDKIADLWQTLFAKEEAPRYETPSKRLQRLMSTGIGMFDAALLGWKLYRKFSGKTLIPRFRRHKK